MKAKFLLLSALLVAGLSASLLFAGCSDQGDPNENNETQPVVETVTDKVYDGWGTFSGTTTDGVPTEGTVETDNYTYTGTFEDGYKITGEGVMTAKDGTITEGTFVNGALDGYGRVQYTNGCLGIGMFQNGQLNGKGFFVWPQAEGAYDWYYGDWVDDGGQKRIGEGVYQWHNGDYYVGEFANDWINGEGTKYIAGGNYWTGTFENGDPKKGSFGEGQMDGVKGYIAVDAETGAWSWYNGELEDGTVIVNGQPQEAEMQE